MFEEEVEKQNEKLENRQGGEATGSSGPGGDPRGAKRNSTTAALEDSAAEAKKKAAAKAKPDAKAKAAAAKAAAEAKKKAAEAKMTPEQLQQKAFAKVVSDAKRTAEEHGKCSHAADMIKDFIHNDPKWRHLASADNIKGLETAMEDLQAKTKELSPAGQPWTEWVTRDLAELKKETKKELYDQTMRALPITLGPQIKLLVKVVKLLKDIHHKKTLDDAKK